VHAVTDVQRELVELAHTFAEREIRPVAAHHDETEEVPWDVLYKAAELGLASYDIPEEYGGGGIEELLTGCLIWEELAWGDAGITNFITSASFFAGVIIELGTDAQRERYVPPLCGAKPVVGSLAATEPGAGSDASAIQTHAKPVDGGYLLNGQKTWISNAGVAAFYLVFATVAPGSRAKGITAFVVEAGDEGFAVGQKLRKLGQRCIPTHELFFHDVQLTADRRVGEEGGAFRGLMRKFDRSRVTLAAAEVGLGRAALEYAVDYAKERQTWGKAIHEYQAVSFRLVDARMKLDQARLMVHHAARLADAGRPFATEAAMAKLAASEACWFCAWACCQTLGGYGYSREYPAERWLRDAKLEEIWEGTSDVMRLIISRDLFPRVR
jgi:acyl-CoA dehydrogenase